MKIILAASLASLGLFITACGSQNTASQGSSSNRRTESLDATRESKSTKLTKKSDKKDDDRKHLDECPAIALHANMLTCDDDDLAVQQQADTQKDTDPSQEPAPTPTAQTPPTELPPPPAPPAVPPPPPKDPNIVEFRIKAGTAQQPWNAASEMVMAKVGQKIRIFNDDTVVHRLHTNGAPCPHGQNIAPGESADCAVTRAYDSSQSGPLYDHIVGPSAAFHVKAIE